MGGELARLVARNGLPGSGHSAPDHPMWQWLTPQLDPADAQALAATLAKARGDTDAYSAPVARSAGAAAAEPGAAVQQASSGDAAAAAQADAVVKAEAHAPQPRAYELRDLAEPGETPAQRAMKLLSLLAALAAGVALFSLGMLRGIQTLIPKGANP
jgi:cobaltochelatase CobN